VKFQSIGRLRKAIDVFNGKKFDLGRLHGAFD
jgi:hypothetical protein